MNGGKQSTRRTSVLALEVDSLGSKEIVRCVKRFEPCLLLPLRRTPPFQSSLVGVHQLSTAADLIAMPVTALMGSQGQQHREVFSTYASLCLRPPQDHVHFGNDISLRNDKFCPGESDAKETLFLFMTRQMVYHLASGHGYCLCALK